MVRTLRFILKAAFTGCLILPVTLPGMLHAQTEQNQTLQLLQSQGYIQPQPVSLSHLYWHFLGYQRLSREFDSR
ncbi:hypothetical protein [Paracidobacterium acidisoli]|uniref:Uncharacterized protein n=1 Tax=Paracidobacterium acidisoli TaxID=2303751 RepID=A0A372IJH2_9BACT|nr:hypothetical protein [Paracidobacterium acidisoli]MBT9332954.1 hypothetical protein [Paracidobacterium acidisoli]